MGSWQPAGEAVTADWKSFANISVDDVWLDSPEVDNPETLGAVILCYLMMSPPDELESPVAAGTWNDVSDTCCLT